MGAAPQWIWTQLDAGRDPLYMHHDLVDHGDQFHHHYAYFLSFLKKDGFSEFATNLVARNSMSHKSFRCPTRVDYWSMLIVNTEQTKQKVFSVKELTLGHC